MDKSERVAAAVAGRPVDRAPVSAWRHFVDREGTAAGIAEATLAFHRDFDWDFVKLNPRATYAAEAWGNRYDFSRYTSVIPTPTAVAVRSAADLEQIRPVDPTGGPFGEQIEAVQRVARGLDDGAPLIQTVFTPLSVVAFLIGGAGDSRVPGVKDPATALRQLMREAPDALAAALAAIADTLGQYVGAVLGAGANGIFYAIVRLAREGALTREEYSQFGRPYDLRVLAAMARVARPAPFDVLHVCGERIFFGEVADYPVQAVNWNSGAPGNPSLVAGLERVGGAVMGGVAEDTTLLRGEPGAVARPAASALAETAGRRVLITPGCGADPSTPVANLRALRDAVEAPRSS